MVEAEGALAIFVQDLLDAVEPLQQRLHLGDVRAMLEVDVRHLVVGEREGARRSGVQQLAAELEPHLDQPGLAQRPVDVHGIADRRDAVFRDDDDACAVPLGLLDQLADDVVDLLAGPSAGEAG